MFCTAEANYRQTQSIARPLCDSRATCFETVYMTDRRTDRQTMFHGVGRAALFSVAAKSFQNAKPKAVVCFAYVYYIDI